MENRFEFCCSDFDVVRSTSECDMLTCDGKQNLVFTLLFQKSSNEYCYCLIPVQLGQYWRCVCENQKIIAQKSVIYLIHLISVCFVKKCLIFTKNYEKTTFLSK